MNPEKQTTFLHKLFLCGLCAFLGAQACIELLGPDRLTSIPSSISGTLAVILIFSFPVLASGWHFFQKKVDNVRIVFYLEESIVFLTALIFALFGWLKLLHMHMNNSLVYDDFRAGALNGPALMDYFFGRVPQLKIIIGTLQVIGAILLVTKRTRLLGIFILLPIVLNIVLMDVFFDIGLAISLLAAGLNISLAYSLWQDRKRFRAFLFPLTAMSSNRIIAFRLTAVALPLLLLYSIRIPRLNEELNGKYVVVSANGEKTVTDGLTAIYFDQNDACVFSYGDFDRIKAGHVIWDKATKKIHIDWKFPEKLTNDVSAKLSGVGTDKLLLAGRIGDKPLILELKLEPLPRPKNRR
ncbi:hypothetical protein [Flavobacterium silvaticum]|uniref:Uncharacterized protein n=1 Tax=Flavobacterium silvaticum TaxID=1852020 RepID=A0A972FL85_9FLAO|nr:hypothetical protein [Flavobacterium silvaticum]NMH27295.1 hypothetical protein [Flavobacterium silvaticum]